MQTVAMYICPTSTPLSTKKHANLLKDQSLILSLSRAWAIISLIIQNPSSAQFRPSTKKLWVCLCVCTYVAARGCVTGCDRDGFPNCFKKKKKTGSLLWLTFACSLQTAACSLNRTPLVAHTHTHARARCHMCNVSKVSCAGSYYRRVSTLAVINVISVVSIRY